MTSSIVHRRLTGSSSPVTPHHHLHSPFSSPRTNAHHHHEIHAFLLPPLSVHLHLLNCSFRHQSDPVEGLVDRIPSARRASGGQASCQTIRNGFSRTSETMHARRQPSKSRSSLQVLNDQHLYHFIDLKPTHAQTRKKRDTVQEEYIQRHELVRLPSPHTRPLVSSPLFRSNEPFTNFLTVASNVAISRRARQNTHLPAIRTFSINGIW